MGKIDNSAYNNLKVGPNSTSKLAHKLLSVVLHEDMVNLLDFIKKLDNECVQISVLNKDRIEELTFVSAFFHHYHYLLAEGCNEEIMSCISNEIHDLVQSRFRQSGEEMLVKLMDHEIPRLLENVRSCISSYSNAESSDVTMTEDHLVELLDAIVMYLQYLHKYCSELTQYEHIDESSIYLDLFD
ncbi:putative ubiquitin carboxyl-terminal hydrolase 20-like [Capsicum annuum]|uniref:Uncharacterized protein n=1 Tax=Capsicum annuum TaxID=4072 RepID=A0A2G2ZJ01_CAPAN|nr:putative ubiquitin carboxyl-terminal hydrolase 20-like [Capsicum annuum]KAF3659833.1 putative ubiquitin carboxyl-terminal hydrolase 20-like [Capsicum annuum]PHT81978.1 hypothetical protein T459_14993 [Capsicum annuum]